MYSHIRALQSPGQRITFLMAHWSVTQAYPTSGKMNKHTTCSVILLSTGNYLFSPFKAKVPQLSLRKPNYHWVARDRQWAEKAKTWHSSGLLYRKGSHPLIEMTCSRDPRTSTAAVCSCSGSHYPAAQVPFTALGSAATPTTQRLRLRN